MAHRLLHHSTPGSRVIYQKKKVLTSPAPPAPSTPSGPPAGASSPSSAFSPSSAGAFGFTDSRKSSRIFLPLMGGEDKLVQGFGVGEGGDGQGLGLKGWGSVFSVQDFKVRGLGLGFRVQRAGFRALCLIFFKFWALGFELSGFVFRCLWLMLRVNMQLGFLFPGLGFRVSCFTPRNPDPYTPNRISGTDLSAKHES